MITDQTLVHFAVERENIRAARAAGAAPPWTKDEILRRYKFTNVRRRDDRVSKWIIEHLIEPAVECGDENLWFTLLVARLINWPPTLLKLLEAGVLPERPELFQAREFVAILDELKESGVKVYSGAYMLYPTRKEPGGSKSHALSKYILGSAIENAEFVRGELWDDDAILSVERIVGALSKCYGVSSFIAGQVAADMTYTGADFSDVYTFAPLGPGSQRGLNMLKGLKIHHSWAQDDFNAELIRIRTNLDAAGIKNMTLHDVQNVMCEFSKYVKVLTGQGAPRSLYKPETEF